MFYGKAILIQNFSFGFSLNLFKVLLFDVLSKNGLVCISTSAIDIWSAGVIMLSLLSRVYPVIKPADDLTSLNLIAQILGTHKMVNAAYAVGKKFHCSPEFDAQDLRLFCQSVSNIHSTPPKTSDENVTNTPAPQLAFDLLAGLLDPNPYTRLSADDALNSPYLSNPYK